jgi:xanthine dehydrogenase accessory factor
MPSPYEAAIRLAGLARPFAVATVVRTQGSTPQAIGAKLIVTADPQERPVGTLGGGCVEADAILAAHEVLASGGQILREYRLTEELAWNTGLVCGGSMWILAEPAAAALCCDGRDLTQDITGALAGGPPIALVTRLAYDGRRVAATGRIAVLADGRRIGSFADEMLDERAVELGLDQMTRGTARLARCGDDTDLLVEPIASRPKIIIAGGGHVARAIARQAALLDYDVTVLEDRPEFADPARFDGAAVIAGDVASSIRQREYDAQSYLVVATRGHKLDADCILAAARTTVPYIGLLGSRRKTILIAEMLRDAQVPEHRIAAIHAPVGLDLGGRTPAEIALSILAEITQRRYGGGGRSLSELRSGQLEVGRAKQ